MSRYRDMSPGALLAALQDDAAMWGEAFMEIVLGDEGAVLHTKAGVKLDISLMIAWFANAIEHSSDVRKVRYTAVFREDAQTIAAMRAEIERLQAENQSVGRLSMLERETNALVVRMGRQVATLRAEIERLKAELVTVTEDRDIYQRSEGVCDEQFDKLDRDHLALTRISETLRTEAATLRRLLREVVTFEGSADRLDEILQRARAALGTDAGGS